MPVNREGIVKKERKRKFPPRKRRSAFRKERLVDAKSTKQIGPDAAHYGPGHQIVGRTRAGKKKEKERDCATVRKAGFATKTGFISKQTGQGHLETTDQKDFDIWSSLSTRTISTTAPIDNTPMMMTTTQRLETTVVATGGQSDSSTAAETVTSTTAQTTTVPTTTNTVTDSTTINQPITTTSVPTQPTTTTTIPKRTI